MNRHGIFCAACTLLLALSLTSTAAAASPPKSIGSRNKLPCPAAISPSPGQVDRFSIPIA